MAKRGGFPGGMNINKLMKEAKKMQADMEETQKEMEQQYFGADNQEEEKPPDDINTASKQGGEE